jgi:acylphosphatase
MKSAYLVNVCGRVQGVGFRWNTRNHAQSLNVSGWVKNNADGSVSAHIQGDPDTLEQMIGYLKTGPAGSRVVSADVTVTGIIDGLDRFEVRFN